MIVNYIDDRVLITVTPKDESTADAALAKIYRDESEVFKNTCTSVQAALQDLIDDLDKVLEVQTELPEILELHSKLTELLTIFNKLAVLDSVYASLTEIEDVSTKLVEITTLYTNIAAIQNVNNNISTITNVNSNLTEIISVYNNLSKIETLYNNITAIISLYTNIDTLQLLETNITVLQNIHTNLTELVILHTNLSALLNVEADLTNINTVATDIANIIIVATNIDSINTSATNIQAIIDAPTFAQLAEDYANKAEDSEVETGKYSALHWAAKSEGFADDSETAKLASETAQGLSEDARNLAEKWAEETEDVEVITGKYSAKHWANKSEDQAVIAKAVVDTEIPALLTNFFDPAIMALSSRSNADGATVLRKLRYLQDFLDELYNTVGLIEANQKLIWLADNPAIVRTDGVLKYYREGLDALNTNDLDGSATASQQPRLVGGIAPNSKPAAANLNGEGRYFTHTPISFEATDAWSVSFVGNTSFNTSSISLFGKVNTCRFGLLPSGATSSYVFQNESGTSVQGASGKALKYIGKNSILSLVADGTGVLKVYYDGVLDDTITNPTNFVFQRLLYGRFSDYKGQFNYSRIQQNALTPTQVLAEHTFLRTLYPEIETVTVDKTIASRNIEPVATCMGNVIANVTGNGNGANLNVSNCENRGYTTFTNVSPTSFNAAIASGSVGAGTADEIVITSGLYYRVSFNIVVNSGMAPLIRLRQTLSTTTISNIIATSGSGSYVLYLKATESTTGVLNFYTSGETDYQITNLAIKVAGWSNATEIYDAVYAATAGTTAQKEYAALKEAAMWRYPYDNLDYGAVMGKHYNWYAAKLFQYDIEQYNLANPTATWGYHVATNQDYIDIADELGGSAVAGKAIKMNGTVYWLTDNGTNESGVTALGSGIIGSDGIDTGYMEITGFWTADEYDATRGYAVTLHDQLDNLIIQE